MQAIEEKIKELNQRVSEQTGRRAERRPVPFSSAQRAGKKAECGHSVLAHSAPTTHCERCWHLFFSINPKAVYANFALLNDGKSRDIERVHGRKFLKHFKRFVLHVQNAAPIEAEDAVGVTV